MVVEISDNVGEVAREFEEFERRTRLYLNDTLNDFGYKALSEQAEQFKATLEGAEPESQFDEIVIKDMTHNLEASTEYADFLRRESGQSAEEMFDLLYGEDAFRNLQDEASSYEDEANYRARALADELVFDDPWKYELDIKKMVHGISDQIEEWAKDEGVMPSDFGFETRMIPQNRNQRANWRGQINQMNLPVGRGVRVIREGENKVYDATETIFSQFHELVGHGVHQQNSEELEYPGFAENPLNRPSAMAHCEGVSQHREKLARKFIEDKGENLPIQDIGMQLRKASEENRDSRELYTRFVKEMLARDEIYEEEAEDRVGEVYNSEIASSALRNSNMSLIGAFQEGCYPSGLMLMDRINAGERDSYAIATGQWAPQVLPDAVDYLEDVSN